MEAVWKFPLKTTDLQSVEMPVGATIVSAALQGETICMWAIVNPEARVVPRRIRIIGTGHQHRGIHGMKFIGTVLQQPFVWHVFED